MTPARTVTVTVTAEHIARGTVKDCCDCPIALALVDAIPEALVAVVSSPEGGMPTVRTEHVPTGTGIVLPPEALAFIKAFDSGKAVAPFTFQVEIPEAAA